MVFADFTHSLWLQMYPNKCLKGYNQGTLQQTLNNEVFIVLALLKRARIFPKMHSIVYKSIVHDWIWILHTHLRPLQAI